MILSLSCEVKLWSWVVLPAQPLHTKGGQLIPNGNSKTHLIIKEEIMSKPKREKFTVSTTSEKPSPEKSFVQVERELTEEQLEVIAGADRGRGLAN